MESRIRLAEQRIQYATLILYQSLRNSNEEKTHQEDDTRERKKELQQQFLQKSTKITETLEIEIDKKNMQEKINMEKRSEGESDIKGKKEND